MPIESNEARRLFGACGYSKVEIKNGVLVQGKRLSLSRSTLYNILNGKKYGRESEKIFCQIVYNDLEADRPRRLEEANRRPGDTSNVDDADQKARKEALGEFSLAFVSHDHRETDFVSYPDWHLPDTNSSWQKGRGEFSTLTYRELRRLWSKVHLYLDYEMELFRFKRRNQCKIRRIFVVGPSESGCDFCRRIILKTLLRHDKLGFQSKVTRKPFISDLSTKANINFDTFCIAGGTVSFLKFAAEVHEHEEKRDTTTSPEPKMLTSTNPAVLRTAVALFQTAWEGSTSSEDWIAEHKQIVSDHEWAKLCEEINGDLKIYEEQLETNFGRME